MLEDIPVHLGTRVGVDEKIGIPKSLSPSSSEQWEKYIIKNLIS